jgi:hypothetical protein
MLRQGCSGIKKLDIIDVEHLLGRVTEDPQSVSKEVKEVFSILTDTTLDFRDRKMKEYGITLTVEDVRIALNWLLAYFRSGQIPQTDHQIRHDLFETWITHLKAAEKSTPTDI